MTRRPTIRRLGTADIPAVLHCFDRCYAGTYPADAFHDAAEMGTLVESGLLRSVIALTDDGEVVGHMGLRLRSPHAITAVAGNTVVDPGCRGHHLAGHLGAALMKLAVDTGLVGTHGYPTTAHPVMQKLEVAGGGYETGVLLDYIPAETNYVGISGAEQTDRLAVVVIYRPLGASPDRHVSVPTRHAEILQGCFERMGLSRSYDPVTAETSDATTQLSVEREPRRGLLRIGVDHAGADLADRVAAETERAGADLTVVDLSLADPAVDAATETLAREGFFFGCLLPEYAPEGDVLRLQKSRRQAPLPDLVTDEAKALLDYIVADRHRGAA